MIAFASSLDQIGPMTKNVYNNALLLNVLSGKDNKDELEKYVNRQDIGVVEFLRSILTERI